MDTLIRLHPTVLKWGEDLRQGIVHRLDKATSGLIICAYEEDFFNQIKEEFASRTVHKRYFAFVENTISTDIGKIDAPIGVDPKNKARQKVIKNGRDSITEYQVIERRSNYNQLDVELVTGRKHQIRTHFAYIGNPILNDKLYGGSIVDSLPPYSIGLHCHTLKFKVNNNEYIYKSKLPSYLENLTN